MIVSRFVGPQGDTITGAFPNVLGIIIATDAKGMSGLILAATVVVPGV